MNQLADNKKLMDFLLYSYFGFSSGDLDQTKKVKCSYRAYLDLARTVKYTYSSTELEKATVGTDAYAFISVQKDRIKFICSKLIESIEGYPNHSGGFNTWHESKCAQIIDRMNPPLQVMSLTSPLARILASVRSRLLSHFSEYPETGSSR